MNITDVGHLTNDSMEQGIGKLEAESQKTGMSPWDIADHFSEAFHQDRKALGILDAESYPRASDYIQHMQEMISQLIKDEYAYVSDGEVYFDVNKFPRFGCLSGNSLEDAMNHIRSSIKERSNKRDQRDFALWKQEENHIMQWSSPWVPNSGDKGGFPGWHIECSAMARAHLGDTIDIHTGGEDNIFPHHEAEIMQSESYTGKQFVRMWMHARHLFVNKQKMSKSSNNYFTVRDAIDGNNHPPTHPAALRLSLIENHYRQHMNYIPNKVSERESFAKRIAEATEISENMPHDDENLHDMEAEFRHHISDDLNMSAAFSVVSELIKIRNRLSTSVTEKVKARNSLISIDRVIGIASLWDKHFSRDQTGDERIEQLIKDRNDARKNKDFAKADMIRQSLSDEGIILTDLPDQTTWHRDSKRV